MGQDVGGVGQDVGQLWGRGWRGCGAVEVSGIFIELSGTSIGLYGTFVELYGTSMVLPEDSMVFP